MVDGQLIGAAVFLVLLTVFLYVKRKQIELQKILFPLLYFAMLRTKLGIVWMDKLAKKWPRFWKGFGTTGVVVGFLGMIAIAFLLMQNLWKLIFVPSIAPGVGIVLPIKIKGAFYVPFFYWLIAIFIIAIVHEFAHGVIARVYNMKIKSSGFAFLGIIFPIVPAAFVEPDEKEIVKRPHKEQLSVFAAGAFTNIIMAALVLVLSIAIVAPAVNSVSEFNGVKVVEFTKGGPYPAEKAGILLGDRIIAVNGVQTLYAENVTTALQKTKPGQTINIETNSSNYTVTLGQNPTNKSKAYLGVSLAQSSKIKPGIEAKYGSFLPNAVLWIAGLFYWLYVLNLGIGLFNLAPLGPIDGGRMMKLAMQRLFKSEKRGDKAWKYISMFFLALVLVNVLFGFFK